MSLKSSKPQIAVVGAGVVGLSTALSIQQTIPSTDVTVIADKFLNETLSFGAGGLFRPEANIGTSVEEAAQWAKTSYDHFLGLCLSSDAGVSGNQLVSGYHISSFSRESLDNKLLSQLIPDIRDLNDNEKSLFPKRFRYGLFWTTIVTDPRYYMPYLTDKIQSNGGRLISRHVECLSELDSYDVVVNCSGLNAKRLVGDWRLTPVRGQTIKVRAPHIKHFYFADDAYVIPGRDYVTLGGIKQYGDSDYNIKDLDRQSIWQRCLEVVPSLAGAPVVMEWVGLRPQRQPLRLEPELIANKRGHSKSNIKVVHNYGHGGHGVTYSWGTAQRASQLVADWLKNDINSRL